MYRSTALVSANEDADLMDPDSWLCTDFTAYDKQWKGTPEGFHVDCIEGNAVVAPDGSICNLARLEVFYPPEYVYNKAVIFRGDTNDPEKPLQFDRVIDAPIGIRHKFVVQHDPSSGKYIMIGNENGPDMPQRTVLTMSISEDLYTWRVAKRLIDYRHADFKHVGFQYPDWIIDGTDILFVSRTAFNRADSFHNSNYVTFHVVEDYQQYLSNDCTK